MKRVVIIATILLLSLTGCNSERFEKAKKIMEQDSLQEVRVAVLFDNSLSYKPFINDTLIQVRDVFQHLASRYPEAGVSLVMIDAKARIIWSGVSRDLQRPYDDLKTILKTETSEFTNLVDAVRKAAYFLGKEKANRRILMIFSDLKHSLPDYFPRDYEVVPPPKDFPWEELRNIEVYAFFVPYNEWQSWKKVADEKLTKIKAFLPEELKTARVVPIVFEE